MKLTRAEVMALQTGREMDACVAEHVMGLELFRDRHGNAYVKGDHGLLENNMPPAYSTEIAACWQMQERIGREWSEESRIAYARNLAMLLLGEPDALLRWEHVWALAFASPWWRCRAALLTLCEERAA